MMKANDGLYYISSGLKGEEIEFIATLDMMEHLHDPAQPWSQLYIGEAWQVLGENHPFINKE